jgi:hypothetical protein
MIIHKPPHRSPPQKPVVKAVVFRPHRRYRTFFRNHNMTGTVQLSPVVAADHVSSRQVVVTINGTALAPIEASVNPATFTCNAGDAISVVDTDINAGGSTASVPFTITAALPTSPPTQPVVLGVVFTP